MVSRARTATLDAPIVGPHRFRMPQNLSSTLSTPLAELRSHWLEERCCGSPVRSPMWFHAVRWPGWLLPDLAMNHGCARCSTVTAVPLPRFQPWSACSRSTPAGMASPAMRFQ